MGQGRLCYRNHRIELVNVHVAVTIGVSAYKNSLEPDLNIGLFANKMSSNELKEIWDDQYETRTTLPCSNT